MVCDKCFICDFLLKHPRSVCMSYKEHMYFSLNLSKLFLVGSLKALVHSFLPSFYITSSSDLQEGVKYLLDNSGCNDPKKKDIISEVEKKEI